MDELFTWYENLPFAKDKYIAFISLSIAKDSDESGDIGYNYYWHDIACQEYHIIKASL